MHELFFLILCEQIQLSPEKMIRSSDDLPLQARTVKMQAGEESIRIHTVLHSSTSDKSFFTIAQRELFKELWHFFLILSLLIEEHLR